MNASRLFDVSVDRLIMKSFTIQTTKFIKAQQIFEFIVPIRENPGESIGKKMRAKAKKLAEANLADMLGQEEDPLAEKDAANEEEEEE